MVVGAGQMGAGIAQVFAAHGHEVLLNDVDEARIKRGIDGIAKRLAARRRERPADSAEARGRILEHIDPRPHFHDLDIALAIEAATEDFDTKLDLFRRLDENTRAGHDPGHQHVFDLDHLAGRGDGRNPSA